MKRLSLLGALLLGPLALQPAHAELFDHSTWTTILQHYVDDKGYVDYAGVRQNAISALESYLEQLGDADMGGWSRDERLAFWINAYNAVAVDLIAQHPMLKKLSDQFELMNKPFKMAGHSLSLNDIEFRVLRGKINPDNGTGPMDNVTVTPEDVRFLFALQPGTLGGPRLVNTAYTAENVETTLDMEVSDFVNSSSHVDAEMSTLTLSSIFRSCRKDFAGVGGVEAFISAHIDPDKRGGDAESLKDTLTSPNHVTTYTYDWTINDVQNKPSETPSLPDSTMAPSEPAEPTDASTPPNAPAPSDATDTNDPSLAPSKAPVKP